ncbi:MAG: hypothetical protein LQ343_001845 [Gyalolechia ehrenbergii]|nr:MAG: hypothetical protein LQ343_001845 [Gyalolechia ehrenbergii]
MVVSKASIVRIIWSKRPLRPPNLRGQLQGLRPFTQNSQLLTVSKTNPRPELPYLYIPSAAWSPRASSHGQYQNQLSRFLTTERKQRIKSETKLTLKYLFYVHLGLVSFGLLVGLISIEVYERKYPTPSEWTFKSRSIYRAAHKLEEPDYSSSGVIEWPDIDNNYTSLLSRLEDPDLDGEGLQLPEDDQDRVWVFGLRKLGFTRKGLDISMKSEEWRRGYYAALMGAARAAEHLDEWVMDRTRGMSCPKEYMIGPSNPHPKPVPYGAAAAPLEENCDAATEPPQTFYTKILTSTGFSTGQRLDAALAYADYLDWKGLHESAEEMFDWGLDIAMGALPMGANNTVDTQTGIISHDATYVSNNLLKATNALAVHHAQMNNLSAALPIFLSILRARKQLSLPHFPEPPPEETTRLQRILSFIKWVLVSPSYPPPTPTGDEAPIRSSKAICEESAIMAYIGEIMFASSQIDDKTQDFSQKQVSGLSWTRDAVDISESTLTSMRQEDLDERQVCADCLKTGMDNWSTMVRKMLQDQQQVKSTKQGKVGGSKSWFWGDQDSGATEQDRQVAEHDEGRWERELALVNERMSGVERLLGREEKLRKAKTSPLTFGTGMIFS